MPRRLRALSEKGHYHVIIRGSGKQLLFEDDDDYKRFLSYLDDMLARHDIKLLAWCLMSNHVHLLIDDADNNLSAFIHDLSTAYAVYFNTKYGRTGPVFEGRFRSVPIESDRQLLSAVLYIHANPVKAGIATMDSYRWSSYSEYASGHQIRTHIELVLDLLNDIDGFMELSNEPAYQLYGFRDGKRLDDAEALAIARESLDGKDPGAVRSLDKAQRNLALCRLRDAGLTVKQISRLTGISSSTVTRNTRR